MANDDPIIAELADGTELEFPAGTKPEIIQATVKKYMGKAAPPPTPAPKPGATRGTPPPLIEGVSAYEGGMEPISPAPPKPPPAPYRGATPPPSIEGVPDYEGAAEEASQTGLAVTTGFSPTTPAIAGAAGALRVLGGLPRRETFEQALQAGEKTMGEVTKAITVPLPETKTARDVMETVEFPFKSIHQAAGKLGDLSLWVAPESPNLAAFVATFGEAMTYKLIHSATKSRPRASMAEVQEMVERLAAEEIAKREGQPRQPRALPPGPSAAEPARLTEGAIYGTRPPKTAGALPPPPPTEPLPALPERAGAPIPLEERIGGARPAISIEESYAQQAQTLGIEYKGMWDTGIEGKPKYPLFNDPVTGTSFMRTGSESVADALMRKRQQFGREPQPPVDVEGAQYEAEIGDLMLEKVYEKAQEQYGIQLMEDKARVDAGVRFAQIPETSFGDVAVETPEITPGRIVTGPTPTGAVSSIVRAYRESVNAGQLNPRVGSAEMIRRGQAAAKQGNEYAAHLFFQEARDMYFSKSNRPFLLDEFGGAPMIVDTAKWLLARSERFRDMLRSSRTLGLDFFTPGNLASEYWREFVGAKGSEKAGRMLESKFFWDDFRKSVPDPLARQAMTMLIQTGGDVKKALEYVPRIAEHDPTLAKGVTQVIEKMANLSPGEKKMAGLVRQHMDEMFKTGVEESVLATYFKDYVTQLWKERISQPKKGTALRSRLMSPKFQFAKERFYTNYLEGMAEGLKPYTLDIADIGRVYDTALARTVFHKQVIDQLQTTGMMKYANAGNIPENWVSVDRLVPASRQHTIDLIREEMFKRTGKALDSNALKDILPQFTNAKVYVHPDAYPILKQFFGRGLAGQDIIAFSNLKKAAITTKQMILSLSGFHYKNLFVDVFSLMRHGKDPVTVLADGLKMNADAKQAKWWVEHDLRIGHNDAVDAYMNMTRATIGEAAKDTGAWNKFKDKAYRGYQANQKFLWEKFVPALKLGDAQVELASFIKRAAEKGEVLTDAQISKAARGIAEVVNRKYGILNWEKMGTTPMAKDIMQVLLLAPDWTLSNLMYLRSAFKGGIEGYKARRDIATSLLVWQTSLNALNYAFSAHNEQRKDESYISAIARGAGHSAWANPPGKRMYLELPGRSREGRKFYGEILSPGNIKDMTRFVMGFGDATEWQRFASGKMHTFPKTGMELIMNKDWAGQDIMDRDASVWRQGFALFGHVARAPLPIPLQAVTEYATGTKEGVQAVTSFFGAGAVTKGPSAYTVNQWMQKGIRTGDEKLIEQAMKTAHEQGIPINVEKLMRQEMFRKFVTEQRASQTPIPWLNKLLHRK